MRVTAWQQRPGMNLNLLLWYLATLSVCLPVPQAGTKHKPTFVKLLWGFLLKIRSRKWKAVIKMFLYRVEVGTEHYVSGRVHSHKQQATAIYSVPQNLGKKTKMPISFSVLKQHHKKKTSAKANDCICIDYMWQSSTQQGVLPCRQQATRVMHFFGICCHKSAPLLQ